MRHKGNVCQGPLGGKLSQHAVKLDNLGAAQSASPAVGLRLMGILPCSLQWQSTPTPTPTSAPTSAAGGKAPRLSYSSTVARANSNPYPLPGSNKCCNNSDQPPPPAASCCQECRCCRRSYEHLPMPRLQQPPPPPPPQVTAAMQAQHQHQHPHQPPPQQFSCITTLQQTTTTQQLPPFPCLEAAGAPAQQPAAGNCQQTRTPCHAHCNSSASCHSNYDFALSYNNSHSHTNSNNNNSSSNNNNTAPPMIFVPFSMPVPPQTVPNPFSHAPKDSAKPFSQTRAPPPPLPPPPPPSLLLPLAFQCHYQTPLPIAGPLPARAPPTPPPRQVLPLKVVAAAAIRAHQQRFVCLCIADQYILIKNQQQQQL
ncbi:hypothetical protein AWZ03_004333 [Drosophila navojoa]|uniref:Uncharacterized protein n=1 Tax=Drosophila navojoa TaxID=7232 RepID=A0A484BKQ0_DRONA|nr:hypothetical protein AWZ03_004333 [Drosophila navojoa]